MKLSRSFHPSIQLLLVFILNDVLWVWGPIKGTKRLYVMNTNVVSE